MTATQNIETYLGSFTDFEKTASGPASLGCATLRAEAFARFCETGFPTTHDEDWRFTNVSTIARRAIRAGKGSLRLLTPRN